MAKLAAWQIVEDTFPPDRAITNQGRDKVLAAVATSPPEPQPLRWLDILHA